MPACCRATYNLKTLYFQTHDKQKQDGNLKSKQEYLKAAASRESEKKYSRETAEAYGNVAMLYEFEGNIAEADKYYKNL